MTALRIALASIPVMGLLHCATPSQQLARAEQERQQKPTEYAAKATELNRDQQKEQAELAKEQRVERTEFATAYSVDVANQNMKVSDARAKLYEDYVKFLADSRARISNLKLRLDAVARRDSTKARQQVSVATRSIEDANSTLESASERTTREWDTYKDNLGQSFAKAEKAVGEAERSVAMR